MNKIIEVKRVFDYVDTKGKARMHLEVRSNYSKRILVRDYLDRPCSFDTITRLYERWV